VPEATVALPHLLLAIEAAQDGVVELDADGRGIYANPAAARILGFPVDELVGSDVHALVHRRLDGRAFPRASCPVQAVLRGAEPVRARRLRLRRPDGAFVHVSASAAPIVAEGRRVGVIVTFTDLTPGLDHRRQLENRDEELRMVLGATGSFTFVVELVTGTVSLSRGADALLGSRPLDRLPLARLLELVDPADRPLLDLAALAPGMLVERAFTLSTALGPRRLRVRARAVGPGAHVERLVGVATDVTREWEAAEAARARAEELAARSVTDELTGLPNRRALEERLATALQRPRGEIGLLLVDLDHFQIVNDSLGHAAGDDLLVHVARRLRSVAPASLLCRLGGDEFALLVEDLPGAPDLVEVGRRVLAALEEPFPVAGRPTRIRASVGAATAGAGRGAAEVLRDADAACHRAKELGRGRVEPFDDALRARALRHLDVAAGLRAALDAGEVSLHFQPVVEVATGRLRAAEALLRFEDAALGPVSPTELIPLAESTGLIVPLGEAVLRRSLDALGTLRAALATRRAASAPPPLMCVNLSGRQLDDDRLAATVRRELRRRRLSPGSLVLEITESTLMETTTGVDGPLAELDRLGVRLAVDDFGTGYSSLLYLRRFPVSTVKLDRVFIAGLGTSTLDTAIVRSVVSLAHEAGLLAIAEGVETEAQLAVLAELRCDLAQGYLFSPALPLEDLIDWARQRP